MSAHVLSTHRYPPVCGLVGGHGSLFILPNSAPLSLIPMNGTHRIECKTPLTSDAVRHRLCSAGLGAAWPSHHACQLLQVLFVSLLDRVGRPQVFAHGEDSLLPPQTTLPPVPGYLSQVLSGDSRSGPQGLASLGEGHIPHEQTFLLPSESFPPRSEVKPRDKDPKSPSK